MNISNSEIAVDGKVYIYMMPDVDIEGNVTCFKCAAGFIDDLCYKLGDCGEGYFIEEESE